MADNGDDGLNSRNGLVGEVEKYAACLSIVGDPSLDSPGVKILVALEAPDSEPSYDLLDEDEDEDIDGEMTIF